MASEKRFNLKTWLVPKLRRLSYQLPARRETLKNSRIERGKYKCAMCNGIFGPKEISLDHIIPVVSVEKGFTNWDDYINRLFCGSDGFQTLCDKCHDSKTLAEDEQRKKK